jgi:hypothetical protein
MTTDTWLARYYKSFIAIIEHWIDNEWTHNSELLDIIKLIDLVYSREYLAKKLLEIIDSL